MPVDSEESFETSVPSRRTRSNSRNVAHVYVTRSASSSRRRSTRNQSQPQASPSPYVSTPPSQPPKAYGVTIPLLLLVPILTWYLQSPWFMLHYRHLRDAGSYIAHSSLNVVSRVQQIMTLEERVRGLESELFHYARGGVARRDFAFRHAGAQILEDLTTPTPPGFNSPYFALDNNFRVAKCWKVPQTSGQMGILLSQPTKITHFSIDHIPRELVVDLMHAPRDIILWGIIDSPSFSYPETEADLIWDAIPRRGPTILQQGMVVVPLAVVRYDITSPNFIQTFNTSDSVFSTHTFSTVIVDILNNWGADYTCLYRVRIHGQVSL